MSKKNKGSKNSKGKKSKDPLSKLKALQKLWKKAAPKKFGKQAPDGDYEVKIISAILEQAKKEPHRLQVLWTMNIIEGDLEGREIQHRSGLEGSEECLDYFQGELETLELELPDNIGDVGDTLQDAVGLELSVTLATRNQYQNVSFDELLEASDDDDEDEDEGEPEDEDGDDEEDVDEDDGEEDEDEYPDEEAIGEMKKKALLALIKEYELEVEDPEDLTLKELRAAVIEASEFEEEEDEDEDEDEDD